MSTLRFDAQDLRLDLPAPGWYHAQVQDARFRRSANGNRMLHVLYAVAEVGDSYCRLSEYFVLEGGSPFGLAMTRRRLADLYWAVGLDPKPGDEIVCRDLLGHTVEIEIGHDVWRGQPRLKVVRHRGRTDEPVASGVSF